ncbi:hypothetical protein PL696_002479 [Pectobacterium atrosepticum]|uniref:hypothetical protein n=1 Tax=Pectobacterium atrosepticum TaxID=29471 RepID=UPI00254C02B6|nr:hypothetical protein [Pectobacterium atrosepticum]MDK9442901.1 hypothetical protein [Pectobacterium atrosepticum]
MKAFILKKRIAGMPTKLAVLIGVLCSGMAMPLLAEEPPTAAWPCRCWLKSRQQRYNPPQHPLHQKRKLAATR